MPDSHQLTRVLGLLSIIAFGLTNEIASGLFFVSTQIQGSAPGVGNLVPLLMIVGGAITLVTVVAYRFFFASGLVGAGGEYVMISRAVNPGIAFVVTVLAWFGFTGSLGTLSYAAPSFLASATHAMGLSGLTSFFTSPLGIVVTGLMIIWGLYAVHVLGVRLAGILVVIAMFLVLAVSALMMIYGFSTSHAGFDAALAAHLHRSASALAAQAPVAHSSVRVAFVSALPTLFFGYLGLSTATQTGGEAKNPATSLARAVLIIVAMVTVVYTLFSLAVYHAVPWQVIAGMSTSKSLATYTTSSGLLQFVMPSWLAALINLCVALIVIKTFLPIYLAQSRWVYAWGQDKMIPGVFSRTHPHYKTPVLALTLSAIVGSISLIESLKLGFVFGVEIRVMSVMLVFFFLGVGMLTLPRRAPHLFKANASAIAKNHGLRIGLGILLMIIGGYFIVSISLSSLSSPILLQPVVQSAIVVAIAVLIYLGYWKRGRTRSPELAAESAARFAEPPRD